MTCYKNFQAEKTNCCNRKSCAKQVEVKNGITIVPGGIK